MVIMEYYSTDNELADLSPDKWKRRYVLVDAEDRPVFQRRRSPEGDPVEVRFAERELGDAFKWAAQITEDWLPTFVFDLELGQRLSSPLPVGQS